MPKHGKAETPEVLRSRFLQAYAACGNLTAAAKQAGVHRSSHYDWLQDPDYQAAFAAAGEEAADSLEAEARRRALEGHAEPVVYQGNLSFLPKFDKKGELVMRDGKPVLTDTPLTVRKFSDVLLIFLLKGLRPDKYRDNFKGEITGAADLFVKSRKVDLTKLTDDELALLEAIQRRITGSGGASGGEAPAGTQPDQPVLPG